MKKLIDCNTIFVDCFDTVVFRKVKPKEIFKIWAEKLSKIYNISNKQIYKLYTKVNFNMCLKKLLTSLTLQENFENVIRRVYGKLQARHLDIDPSFIQTAHDVYFDTELENFVVNDDMIDFLRRKKEEGKKIFLVSDFYCKSDTLSRWFSKLNIIDVFEQIFSSSDFNKEKATSKIYKYLLKNLNLQPHNVIMYGDNAWSDVFIARMCGLGAKRIKIKITKDK